MDQKPWNRIEIALLILLLAITVFVALTRVGVRVPHPLG